MAEILNHIRTFLNTDIGIIISTIGIVTGWTVWGTIKKLWNSHLIVQQLIAVLLILTLFLILPVFILIYLKWNTWIHIAINLIAIIQIFGFFTLLWMINTFSKMDKKQS